MLGPGGEQPRCLSTALLAAPDSFSPNPCILPLPNPSPLETPGLGVLLGATQPC